MSIPSPRVAAAAVGRSVLLGDPAAERAARQALTAAKVNASIDGALTAAGIKREHAAELSARLNGAAR